MKQPAKDPVSLLFSISSVSMLMFVYLFVSHNAPGFTGLPWIILLGFVYCLAYALSTPVAIGSLFVNARKVVVGLLYLAALVALPLIFLQATVWDYYQPLSLFDDAILCLAISWLVLLLTLLLALLKGDGRMVPAAAVALAGPLLVVLLARITDPQPVSQLALHMDVFKGGEDGYDVYRIPGLLVLPRGSVLASGAVLPSDRLLAFAEARADGALDTGAIDLVMKTSDDGGDAWSEQAVVCSHRQDGQRGKCGNATPLFDARKGVVWLAYNLSGIPGDLPEGPRPHSAHLVSSGDGGDSWSAPLDLPFDNAVFGPGHGIQKHLAPAVGRLILPAYMHGTSFAIYSDDHGQSWNKGADLGVGNEAEVAELPDGRLYMATRHAAPIGRPPQSGRLFALSSDGGASWSGQGVDGALPTPVCQASVVVNDEGVLYFSNPAHERARVRMTVRASQDNGRTWPRSLQVYPGPAGYSELGVLSSNDIVLLYERGRMSYSEKISFARFSPAQLKSRVQ